MRRRGREEVYIMLNFIWCLAIVHSILCFLALLESLYHYLKAQKCTKNILGIIIDIEASEWYGRNSKGISYLPIYRYEICGKTYEKAFCYATCDPQKYKIGQEILLEYEEKRPFNFVPSQDRKVIKKNVIRYSILLLVSLSVLLFCNFAR